MKETTKKELILMIIGVCIILFGLVLVSSENNRREIYDYTGSYDGYAREKVNYSLFNAENFTGARVDITGNISLGEKVTFAFGEMIDNIVDGWIRITGSLNVTENVNVENDLTATQGFFTNLTTDTMVVNIYINMTDGNITDANTILTDFLGSANERVLTAHIKEITGVDFLQFNITYTDGCVEGRMTWNTDDGTLQYGLPGGEVCLQIGQENLRRVKANETMIMGTVVYSCGSTGNRLIVCPTDWDSFFTSLPIGILTENITENQFGFINTFGLNRDIDTTGEFNNCVAGSTFNSIAWLSNDGQFTCTTPPADKFRTVVGVIVKANAESGILDTSIDIVPDIPSLSYVNGTGMTNLSILQHDSGSLTWKMVTSPIFNNLTILERIIQNDYYIKSKISNPLINGDIFAIFANATTPNDIPFVGFQPGGPGQASWIGGSLMLVNRNETILNTVNASSCQAQADSHGIPLFIDCNSSSTANPLGSGPDLLSFGDYQGAGEFWLRKTEGDWKFLSRTLSLIDKMFSNLMLNNVNSTINGTNFSFVDEDGNTLIVNIADTETILTNTADSINLLNGSNSTPNNNFVYYTNENNPTLTVTTTEPTGDFAEVGRFLVGNDGFSYSSVIDKQSEDEAFKGLYLRAFDEGPIYISGYVPVVNSTTFNITGPGQMTIITHRDISEIDFSTDNFYYYVNGSNDYVQSSTLQDITQYSDGSLIGNAKYFNAVLGIIHNDAGDNRLTLLLQNSPTTEYFSVSGAEIDELGVTVFSPSGELEKRTFIPIGRIVMQRLGGTNTIQTLTNGEFFLDLRGTAISAGGGAATPAISQHNELDNLDMSVAGHSGDWDNSGSNITANWFLGLFNWTIGSLDRFIISSFDGASLDISLNETELNNSIDSRSNLLNVNSSDFWDNLDTPADINGSEINNDLSWINLTEGVNAGFNSTFNITYDEKVDRTGDTMTGDLTMSFNFLRESISYVSLYDGSSQYNNFLPAFSDTLFYGNNRGIILTSNRAVSGGSLNNMFDLTNQNDAEWTSVSSANPVILNITYDEAVWGDGPFLNDFEMVFSWRQSNAINYSVEIYQDADDNGIYTWITKCDVVGNDDYIEICPINNWRVREIRVNITEAGDGDMANNLRIGTIQAKSSINGDGTGHLASRDSNTFYGIQNILAAIKSTDWSNVSGSQINNDLNWINSSDSEKLAKTINQNNHGFVVGHTLYYNGSDYLKALSNDSDTLGIGMVSEVINSSQFTFTQEGFVSNISVIELTAGEFYFVSETDAGNLTTTEGSEFSNPIFLATNSTAGYVLNWRASTIGGAIDGSDINNNLNWINLTQGVTAGFNSTSNATYDAKADYQFTTNNFNGSGNVTASFFKGDGSELTGISGISLWTENTTAGTTWLTNTSMNVGIGTTNPTEKFEVKTAINNYGFTHTDGTEVIGSFIGSGFGFIGTKSNSNLGFFTNSSVSRLTIDTSGNVGIGDTTPTNKLYVNSGTDNIGIFQKSTDRYSFMGFADSTTTSEVFVFNGADGDDYVIGTNGNVRMTINSSGNVGIGTTSPNAELTISDGTDEFDLDVSTNTFVIKSTTSDGSDDTVIGIDAGAGGGSSNRGAAMYFYGNEHANVGEIRGLYGAGGAFRIFGGTGGTERLHIDTSGNVGIGDISPSQKLSIVQTTGGATIGMTNSDATNPYGMIMDFSGGSPDDNTRYFLAMQDSTTVRAYIYSDGDMYNHDGVFGIISDQRFKSNVVNTTNQLNKILQLNVRDYEKFDTTEKKGIGESETGFVAQELELIYPNVVHEIEWNNETVKAINTVGLIPELVKAIQELKAENDLKDIKINAMNSTIQTQQGEIDDLELELNQTITRLDKIEQMLNITYVEPEEDSLDLYYCEAENSTRECPFPPYISGGKHTRCYTSFDFIVEIPNGWDYCSGGWVLQ